jgi:pyridoxal phosphate enzyme (YggS family)
MSDRSRLFADHRARVRERIAGAARQSGRPPQAVRLVAVTKYVGTEDAAALLAAGCADLAESRPQALWAKAEALRDRAVQWHLVGHLQRNKIARTLEAAGDLTIHSADSLRLLEALDDAAAHRGRAVSVLLEVNISREAQKGGFEPDSIEPLLPALANFRNVQVRGLMGMAAQHENADDARPEFARLRALGERLAAVAAAGLSFAELSMGMSHDFEQAILEGATLVRVGSALFEGLP